MLSSINSEKQTIPNIPNIPIVPKLPLMKSKINNPENVVLKKFRCLSLSTLSGNDMNSVFTKSDNITLDTKLVEEFFIIKNEKKIIAKVSENMRENEIPSISTALEKNKYTSIYISVNKLARAFNFEALLENIDNIFCENCECDEEIVKILLNEDNQRLFKQTFLSESELNIINNINNPIVTTQTESWLLKIAKNKKINILLDNLFRLNILIHILKEESQNLERYLKCYEYIINNEMLQTLLNIILNIHNHLNNSNGKKEEKNFDVRNISNIMTLKYNNRQFMDILLKIYFDNSNKTINRSEFHALHTIIESEQLPINLNDYDKHKSTFESIKESLNTLSLNKIFLTHIERLYDELLISFKDIYADIQSERTNQKLLLEYFIYPVDSKPDIINSIFSNCYTLLSKLTTKPINSELKVVTPPLQKKNNPIKENNKRASNLINKYNLN